MLEIFNRGIAAEPALVIDPVDGFPLIKALRGAWYYPTDKFGKVSKDLPKKPIHPHEDIGDAFCYFVGRIAPGNTRSRSRDISVETSFDPANIHDYETNEVESDFDPSALGRNY